MRHLSVLPIALALLAPSPASAQLAPGGQIAGSAVGQGGRRQTREQAADEGIEPLARLDTRVQNRVQSRLRNRIDRFYGPQSNAISPFEVASEQARAKSPVRRR